MGSCSRIPDSRAYSPIQSPAIASIEVSADLDSAARYFAEQIDRAAPAGPDGTKPPVTLLGWSFGGSVTTAVAAALAERGRAVESLVLVDAFARSPPSISNMSTRSPPQPRHWRRRSGSPELAPELTVEQAVGWCAAAIPCSPGWAPTTSNPSWNRICGR